jgi:hypothetical protein
MPIFDAASIAIWNRRLPLPFPRNKSFVPREALFRSLNDKLPPSGSDQSAALYGLGGAGKTQTALEFAYQRADLGYRVFWVSWINEGEVPK